MKLYSLSKSIIIRKNDDFDKIFQNGKLYKSTYFRIFMVSATKVRVGFAVGRGLVNKVQRNRLKRRTRELWRTQYRNFNVQGDVIIIAKKQAFEAPFSELEKDFINLLHKISRE